MMLFASRSAAGRLLAGRLQNLSGRDDVVVLALPRGGVPVAFEIAAELAAPLDVFVVRRIRTPGMQDVTMGVVGSAGTLVIDGNVVSRAQIPGAEVEYAIEAERAEVERREKAYRGARPALDVRGKTVVLVDDGLGPSSNMGRAVDAVQRRGAARVIAAVPVAEERTLAALPLAADDIACLATPRDFQAVSMWYADYPPVWDDEVRDLLTRATEPVAAGVA